MEGEQVDPKALFTLFPMNDVASSITEAPNNRYLARRCKLVEHEPLKIGLQVGFQIPCSSQYTLATIGRDDTDILVTGQHFSRIQCSFEIDTDTYAILLHDRSRGNTTQFYGASAFRFQDGRPHRQVVIDEHTNLEFGFGGSKCDLAKFLIIWHLPKNISIKDLVKDRIGNPRKNRTIDLPDTSAASRRITRIHTPAEQANMRYIRKEYLGGGAFGQVYKALNIDSGKFIAMKEVDLPSIEQDLFLRVKREVEIHAMTCHLNVIDFLGYQIAREQAQLQARLQIFLPLQDGNLETLKLQGLFVDRSHVNSVTYQMLQALDYLASKDIVHKDVKPENILFTILEDGSRRYVLSDFGLSNLAGHARTLSGSPLYQAPEIDETSTHRQTTKVDVWSLFVTIADILNVDGFRAKPMHTKVLRLAAIAAAARSVELSQVKAMAHEDPNQRASAADILEDVFNGEGRTTRKSRPAMRVLNQEPLKTPAIAMNSLRIAKRPVPLSAAGPAGIQKRRVLERQNPHRNLFVAAGRFERFL